MLSQNRFEGPSTVIPKNINLYLRYSIISVVILRTKNSGPKLEASTCPAVVFCDDMSVVKNSSIPTSALNNRYNKIFYHRFREDQAAGILRVGWIPGAFNLSDFKKRQQCLGIQDIICLIQYSLTQHHQLVIFRRRRLICTWVHLSTSHTKRAVAEIGFWDYIYIFYTNRSSMVVNLRILDKYGSKHTGSQKNIQVNIGGTFERIKTDRVYIREVTVGLYMKEGKDMRTLHLNDQMYLWYEQIVSIQSTKNKIL